MRFTDNAELTAANMANADILAGTDVSASTDKKFTLSGLADWFLNRFTGLSLAGKNQSVKAALDELNSTLTGYAVYTPTFQWSNGDAVTVANPAFWYMRCGKALMVFGRFNLTNKGDSTETNKSLWISIPSGVSLNANNPPAAVGYIVPNTADYFPWVVRKSGNNIVIEWGAGGHYSYSRLNTGYYTVMAILPLA